MIKPESGNMGITDRDKRTGGTSMRRIRERGCGAVLAACAAGFLCLFWGIVLAAGNFDAKATEVMAETILLREEKGVRAVRVQFSYTGPPGSFAAYLSCRPMEKGDFEAFIGRISRRMAVFLEHTHPFLTRHGPDAYQELYPDREDQYEPLILNFYCDFDGNRRPDAQASYDVYQDSYQLEYAEESG